MSSSHFKLCIPIQNCALLTFLEARTMKSEVNLLSLLSTFDDVLDALPDEKEGVSQKEETVKLPRTNSLEDLGIKVCITLRKNT